MEDLLCRHDDDEERRQGGAFEPVNRCFTNDEREARGNMGRRSWWTRIFFVQHPHPYCTVDGSFQTCVTQLVSKVIPAERLHVGLKSGSTGRNERLPSLLAPLEAFTGGGRRRKAKQARSPLAKETASRTSQRSRSTAAAVPVGHRHRPRDTTTQNERLHARQSRILGWSDPHERRPRGRKCSATRSHPAVEREPRQRRRGSSVVTTPGGKPAARRGGDSPMRESHRLRERGITRRQCQFQCQFFFLFFPTPLRGEQPPHRLDRTPPSVLDGVGDRHSHSHTKHRRRRRRGFAGPHDW
jgi:hypothetical protein